MDPNPQRIYWWARQHALIILIGVGAAWLERSGLLLAAMAGASLLGVFSMPRIEETTGPSPLGTRLLGVTRILSGLAIIAEPPTDHRLILALAILLAGMQLFEIGFSKQRSEISQRQQLIQQETDALWLIALAFLVAPLTPLGKSILAITLIRPLWIIGTHWNGPPPFSIPWDSKRRLLSLFSTLALAGPLTPGISPQAASVFLVAGGLGWIALHALWLIGKDRWNHKKSRPSSLREESESQRAEDDAG